MKEYKITRGHWLIFAAGLVILAGWVVGCAAEGPPLFPDEPTAICERHKLRGLIDYFARDFRAAALDSERAIDTASLSGVDMWRCPAPAPGRCWPRCWTPPRHRWRHCWHRQPAGWWRVPPRWSWHAK